MKKTLGTSEKADINLKKKTTNAEVLSFSETGKEARTMKTM